MKMLKEQIRGYENKIDQTKIEIEMSKKRENSQTRMSMRTKEEENLKLQGGVQKSSSKDMNSKFKRIHWQQDIMKKSI